LGYGSRRDPDLASLLISENRVAISHQVFARTSRLPPSIFDGVADVPLEPLEVTAPRRNAQVGALSFDDECCVLEKDQAIQLGAFIREIRVSRGPRKHVA